MVPAPAPRTPVICEKQAQLECRFREAEDTFRRARTAIRQMVGRSSRTEYLTLAVAADTAWDGLQLAGRELARHLREHQCGMIQEAAPTLKPIW